MKNKKIIFLEHNGGRLANQIWPIISIYAFCLEKGYRFENHCFFEYAENFNISSGNLLIDLTFYWPYRWLKRIVPQKKQIKFRDFFRKIYARYVRWMRKKYSNLIDDAPDAEIPQTHYLPPTSCNDPLMLDYEHNEKGILYLCGPAFRNRVGLEKYRSEIKNYIRPEKNIEKKVIKFMTSVREKFNLVVGVHIRQTDYLKYRNGELFFRQDKVREILDSFLMARGLDKNRTAFIICSDGPIEMERFKGLNIFSGPGNMIEDLFTLASTDFLIGSDSTFGAFASYYGNIPMAVFERDGIDWEKYEGKDKYFENPKCTTVFY